MAGERGYGLVLDPNTLEIDLAATARARERMA